MANPSFWKKYVSANSTKYTATTATTGTAYTPASTNAFRCLGYSISTDTAQTVTISIGGTAVIVIYAAANGGANLSGQYPIFTGTAGQAITVTTSQSGNCTVSLWGYED